MDLVFDLIVNKLRNRPAGTPMISPTIPKLRPAVSISQYQRDVEKKNIKLLEPSTAEFARSILIWARSNGIPASLGETYRSSEDQANIPEGRTAIKQGDISWHQVGRAFHLIIKDAKGQLDADAYKTVGEEVTRRGGVWLGDRVIKGPKGSFVDLAHFEYHPGLALSSYRRSPLATRELAQSEKRAARYG
jgi:hypothetical protein